eukprot:451153-Pyramimonas_sp.AAC.1
MDGAQLMCNDAPSGRTTWCDWLASQYMLSPLTRLVPAAGAPAGGRRGAPLQDGAQSPGRARHGPC